MAARSSSYLIVGGDSQIGRALRAYLGQTGDPIYWTSRRPTGSHAECLELDLATVDDSWTPPDNVGTAVICAAATRIESCRQDPHGTARVNVEGTLKVTKRLSERGAFVVFLSTNQVFSGDSPYCKTDDPRSPRSTYGKQKAEAECRLRDLGPAVAILRCTKLLANDFPLIRSWMQALATGQRIEPFADMNISPVPMATAVAVIRLIADCQEPGVYHLSGERDLSYAELAQRAARLLGVPEELVHPVSAAGAGLVREPIPAHTTLEVESLNRLLGINPPPVDWTIDWAIRSVMAQFAA